MRGRLLDSVKSFPFVVGRGSWVVSKSDSKKKRKGKTRKLTEARGGNGAQEIRGRGVREDAVRGVGAVFLDDGDAGADALEDFVRGQGNFAGVHKSGGVVGAGDDHGGADAEALEGDEDGGGAGHDVVGGGGGGEGRAGGGRAGVGVGDGDAEIEARRGEGEAGGVGARAGPHVEAHAVGGHGVRVAGARVENVGNRGAALDFVLWTRHFF